MQKVIPTIRDTRINDDDVQMAYCVVCFEYADLNNVVKHTRCAGIVCCNCLLQMDAELLSKCVYCRCETNEFSNRVKKIKFENIKVQRAEEAWNVDEIGISENQIIDRTCGGCVYSYNNRLGFILKHITILNLAMFIFSNILIYAIGIITCLFLRILPSDITLNPLIVWFIGILTCICLYILCVCCNYCSEINRLHRRRLVGSGTIVGLRMS